MTLGAINHLTVYMPTTQRVGHTSETAADRPDDAEIVLGSWKVALRDDSDEARAWEALSDEVFDSWEESLKNRQ